MSKVNKHKNLYYGKFKSHIDVNNYNKFLMDLDSKNQSKNDDNFLKIMFKNANNNSDLNKTLTEPTKLIHVRDLFKQLNPNFETNLQNYDFLFKDPVKKTETIQRKQVNIQKEINCIQDLLDLIETYPLDDSVSYNINMDALHKIKIPLSQLNQMIGIKTLKENIVDQILFYIQDLNKSSDEKSELKINSNSDFMHTIIYGPPGTGKTEVAKIIGAIFSDMGILKKGTFTKVTRSDLIAGYLGQTALKTKDVIKECLGGVLFIDEAYSLGNEEKRDSFSKECIDTLCESLSNHKDELMVIIAGYETDLNTCFFNQNQGLNSRFTWRFKIDEYSAEDLYKIFLKKVKEGGWTIANDEETNSINVKWFEKNKSKFKSYGRDIETLFAKTKIAHSRRVFCLDNSVKKIITLKDIEKGLEIYNNNNTNSKQKEDEEKIKQLMYSMYT